MATVHDVAALIIEEQHASGRSIDKMQLQKFLYVVQGASVRRLGHPAFRATFRAYDNGPVVEQVESTYRDITEGAAPLPGALGGDPGKVPDAVREVVAEVLNLFGDWQGRGLEKITKLPGSPWKVIRGENPDDRRAEIPDGMIARWFVTHPINPNVKERDDDPVVRSFNSAEELLDHLG